MFHCPFILLVFLFFIDTDIAYVNTELNWTCPGGYIEVGSAIWLTPGKAGPFIVITQMKNRCDNKASCVFTLNDTNIGVSCDANCSQLLYSYECVSKSLVLRILVYYFLTNLTWMETIDTMNK